MGNVFRRFCGEKYDTDNKDALGWIMNIFQGIIGVTGALISFSQ